LNHIQHWLQDLNSPEKWTMRLNHFSDTSLAVLGVVAMYLVAKFAIYVLAERIAKPLIEGRGHEGAQRLNTLTGLIRSVSKYLLNFVFLVALLRALNFDAVSVVSTAGFAGLAFGFGAQKLVKDVINGFFLIMEDQYDVGDYVTINTITGVVEEIGMRIMKIRDDNGKLYILSNGDISQVCNMSRGALAGTMEIGIAPGENTNVATALIDKAGEDLMPLRPELCLTQPPKVIGIGTVDAAHIGLKVLFKVSDPSQLPAAQTAMRGLALERLHEGGIGVS